MAFGVDRSPNPWNDIPLADVLLLAASNVADCSPITTDYIWRCRDRGGKLIVIDPRMTPITRNADLYLPVRPGTDLALFMGMLHVILRDGLENRTFIDNHTVGFDKVEESAQPWTREGGRAFQASRLKPSKRPRTGSPPASADSRFMRAASSINRRVWKTFLR